MASKRSVILKRYNEVQKELEAGEAVTPGMLVERAAGGKFQKHSTAGGNAIPMFPKENVYKGEGIDTDYSTGDKARILFFQRGDEVYAILKDGESVSEGGFLESAGDGTLQAYTQSSAGEEEYPNTIVAVALEDLDLTDSSGGESSNITYTSSGNARIKVEIV